MNVVVVDDEPVTRCAVTQVLQANDYTVTQFSNGPDALRWLSSSRDSLVICDWTMPGMTGLEVCRTIRSTFRQRYIYFVLLTSHSSADDVRAGLEAGADDYVTKPFNPAELVLRINTGRRIIRSESSSITIFALAKLAESRDPDTGKHLERVQAYCGLLAKTLQHHPDCQSQIDDNFARLIFETSPLHDIGKVAVPDAVLLKPGRLTAAEFEVMKTHTTHGAETLAAAMQEFPDVGFLRMAHEIALCHHERYDGFGYPHQLSGQAIPLSARIVALADVYDALRSKRVYKGAFSHRSATMLIQEERGRHFDPAVVDAFLSVEKEFLAIHRRFLDVVPSLHWSMSRSNGGRTVMDLSELGLDFPLLKHGVLDINSEAGEPDVCATV